MDAFQPGLTIFQEGSVRIIPRLPCFASLPAELRNNVYQQTLKYHGQLVLFYHVSAQRFQIHPSFSTRSRSPLKALKVFSNLDHYIRQEARSFFFANNSFEIVTKQNLTTDPDYVQVYIDFLSNIGETGRRSLRQLELVVNGDTKQHLPEPKIAVKFWKLLADCMNLERLHLFLDVDYFYLDQLSEMKYFLSTHGPPINRPWPLVLETLSRLKNLAHVFLSIVFSSRWHHVDVELESTTNKSKLRDPGAVKRIRFRVKRPINEAAQLTLHVRGFLRRELRYRMTARTLATERWGAYGADLSLGRVQKHCDDLVLLDTGRIKPQERQFNYNNGFDGW